MNGNGAGLTQEKKSTGNPPLDIEAVVRERYRKAAGNAEPGLCVPVNYDRSLLEIIPAEILEKDYGCGDPSKYVRQAEIVLDLGSGSGKTCFIIAQIVGPNGRVIGVDFNEEMLTLSRKHQTAIEKRLGYHNVEFRRGRIQNLRVNLELLDEYLKRNPVRSVSDLSRLRDFEELISREQPLIPDESIDVIVSNCVLNLVRPEDKQQLFSEMYRVLRKGGRIAISDIVSDEPAPDHLKNDPELWSGCVSGAFQEEEFLRAFEEAKFYGIHLEDLRSEPYQIIEGIEFRSVTITAHKGKEGPCIDRNQAVIYRGPWKQVVDDDDHVLPRGVRIAVCEKTYNIYSRPPYQEQFVLIPPREEVAVDAAPVFDCSRDHRRHPRETKGLDYNLTRTSESLCGPGSACCP
ncbi:MAG: methyltransferase domain-containing protein [Deltaproteobacteria bacterium]|nr:methyltransferase domain-containing protein [Deltaproteobacteria bacterium]